MAGLLDGLFAFLPETAAVWTTHAVSAATAFAIITALHIVLGELVPKAVDEALRERGVEPLATRTG